jgi:hypothetical protein
MPDPASHAFAFNTNLWDSSFTVGTIQLALGTLTDSFFPEVLGYNMGTHFPFFFSFLFYTYYFIYLFIYFLK